MKRASVSCAGPTVGRMIRVHAAAAAAAAAGRGVCCFTAGAPPPAAETWAQPTASATDGRPDDECLIICSPSSRNSRLTMQAGRTLMYVGSVVGVCASYKELENL
eukprot:GHUV01032622.1.p1 GENE.GHUV01032622.1~~GHUV01032622.1.p1  ORF type:complete len:105 (-),score=20.92 GHUV01032622.1:799-1113(-)